MLAHRGQASQPLRVDGRAGRTDPEKIPIPASRVVFSIPELVSAILDQVNQAPVNQWRYSDFGVVNEERPSRQKWTVLARVNKLLFMSAIPKIWECVDDLSCFATLFPEDLLDLPHFVDPEDYRPNYSALRLVKDGDLDRYLLYTSFVRNIQIFEEQRAVKQGLTRLITHWVHATNNEANHFINVQHLSLTRSLMTSINQYLNYLKTPSLRSLRLYEHATYLTDRRAANMAQSLIVASFPNLEMVELYGSTYEPEQFSEQIYPSFLRLPSLKSFRLQLTLETLRCFFDMVPGMPSFQVLVADIKTLTSDNVTLSSRPPDWRKPHTLLNEVTFIGLRIDNFLAAFQIAKESNIVLNHVGSFMAFPALAPELSILLQTFARDFSEISTFVVEDALAPGLKESWKKSQTDVRYNVITPTHLRSLVELRNLAVLKLKVRGIMVITGQFLEMLAAGCPGLQTCMLNPEYRPVDDVAVISGGDNGGANPNNHMSALAHFFTVNPHADDSFEYSNWKLATLIDVVRFASSCHGLINLGIRMDACRHDESEEEDVRNGKESLIAFSHLSSPLSSPVSSSASSSFSSSLPSSHSLSPPVLSYLDVGSSSINDAEYVLGILSAAFPMLQTLVWAPHAPNMPCRMTFAENELWSQVMEARFN